MSNLRLHADALRNIVSIAACAMLSQSSRTLPSGEVIKYHALQMRFHLEQRARFWQQKASFQLQAGFALCEVHLILDVVQIYE